MSLLSSLSISCHCMLLVSLSLLVIISSPVAHGGGGGEPTTYHKVPIHRLLPPTICSTPKPSDDPSKLTVFNRHGPCLLGGPKPSHKQILKQDQSHVRSIQLRMITKPDRVTTTSSVAATLPDHTGRSLHNGGYIVTVGFGTPKKNLAVVFDTGSDLTWTQCNTCPKSQCYSQHDRLFNPSLSTTSLKVSCSSPACNLLHDSSTSHCVSAAAACRYDVRYGDNSSTMGSLIQDTLTLTPTEVVPNFIFGCADSSGGLFGEADGLIGLGRTKVSLISQTNQKYGGVFSYCLPSTPSTTGYLKLGGGTPPGVKFTEMVTKSNMGSFYFVDLVAIIVGGEVLDIPQIAFSNPGTVLDSGTVITRLPKVAYSVLRSTYRKMMPKKYPAAPPVEILDTCYDLSGHYWVDLPAVAFKFADGVVLDVDFRGLIYVVNLSQACLAFAGIEEEGDVAIIGNVNQRTYNVVYDLNKQKIGFGQKGCL